jgi:ribosomal-protein-serine acetyltransferase
MRKYEISVEKDLAIRSWNVKDALLLFKLVDDNREILKKWLAWVPGVKEVEDSRKFILKCLKEYKEKTALEMGLWRNGRLIGCIGLHHIEKDNKKASLGYWLSKNSQGKGVMTLAIKALVHYGFNKLNLNRIDLKIGKENVKSRAIPERLGFKQEGIMRDDVYVDNRFVDHVVYSVLKKEWCS